MASVTISKKPLEPLTIFEKLLVLMEKNAKFIVGDFITESWTWKWNLRVFHGYSIILFTAFCYGYSSYQSRHVLADFVFYACLVIIDFISFQRLFSWSINQGKCYEMIMRSKEFVKEWEQKTDTFSILLWYYKLLQRVMVGFFVSVYSASVVICIGPPIYFLITGNMFLAVQLFIPNVDYTSHPGYEFHLFFHAWVITVRCTGVFTTTMICLIILIQTCTEIDVLRTRLQELSTKINEKDESNKKEINKLLKDIFEAHQVLIEYIDSCEDVLTYQNICDHVFFGIMTCLSLFI